MGIRAAALGRGDAAVLPLESVRLALAPPAFKTFSGPKPQASRRRHGLLHRRDQLAEREGFWQEGELLVFRQALLEGVLGIAGDEDDLEVGIAPRIAFSSVGPSISGITTSETTRSTAPFFSSSASIASTPLAASITL
jgi:hypothetical protein